jgi:hypothetical protein
MESGRAAPLFRLHRRARRSLPNDLNPGSSDQRDRSDNRIRQLITAGARHRNGDDPVVTIRQPMAPMYESDSSTSVVGSESTRMRCNPRNHVAGPR